MCDMVGMVRGEEKDGKANEREFRFSLSFLMVKHKAKHESSVRHVHYFTVHLQN